MSMGINSIIDNTTLPYMILIVLNISTMTGVNTYDKQTY